MKTCSTCNEIKLLEDFYKKSSSKDGREYYCKACHKLRVKSHYERNTETYKKQSREYKEKKTAWFQELKSKLSCKVCGTDKPWRLAFHHRDPSTKEFGVAAITSHSIEEIVAEIEKCDVLCHNCHADEHEKLRQNAQVSLMATNH